MEMARILPIAVQFGAGAVLCGIGIWSGLRSGYIDPSNRADRRLVYIVVAGFLGLLLLASAFTFWLPELGNPELGNPAPGNMP